MINFFKNKDKKGLSIMELLIVVAIMFIITTIGVASFSSLSNSESLDKDVTTVVSFIYKAKNNSINSLNFEEHGVSFSSTTITIFYGKTLNSSSTSTSFSLSSGNTITQINLSNSSNSFYFNKLTGEPSATGTISIARGEENKLITIYATGFIDVE